MDQRGYAIADKKVIHKMRAKAEKSRWKSYTYQSCTSGRVLRVRFGPKMGSLRINKHIV